MDGFVGMNTYPQNEDGRPSGEKSLGAHTLLCGPILSADVDRYIHHLYVSSARGLKPTANRCKPSLAGTVFWGSNIFRSYFL